MDNSQTTTKTEDEVVAVCKKATKECLAANMPLQNWNSNSTKLQTLLKEERLETELPVRQNLLGLVWDVKGDRTGLYQPQYPNQELTKRSLLSQASLLFDPLGILSSITIRGKVLIQEAWKEKLDWDTVLSEHYSLEWEK